MTTKNQTIDNGGPAFPGLHPSAECRYKEEGMTLRDYFAAKAMQGFFASGNIRENVDDAEIAIDAWKMADALLAARKGGAA